MQWKVSSSLAAITSLFLLSAVDLVVAQISAPFCIDTGSWLWSYNSLDQNPCTVAAYLLGTCYNGVFDLAPLGLDSGYAGPNEEEVLQAGSCWCNTVIYNLASACSECQGGLSISWAEYDEYCTTTQPPSTFPNPVPAGTTVPQWALVAISGANYWDPTTAIDVGDAPETTPGELIDGPAPGPGKHTSSTPSHTGVSAPTSTTPSSGNELNQGVIAGAGSVVLGVTSIAAISGLVLTLIS